MGMSKEEFKKQLLHDIVKYRRNKEAELNNYTVQARIRMKGRKHTPRRFKIDYGEK